MIGLRDYVEGREMEAGGESNRMAGQLLAIGVEIWEAV
jgi:hypothetical protein